MDNTILVSTESSGKVLLKKFLLTCGIISSLHYVAINIIVPMQYQGYSTVTQTVSELSAIGAPTRPLWAFLCIFYSLLIVAFSWGIWKSANRNRSLRIIAILMFIYGVSGFFWPPMHQRGNEPTLTDTMHIIFSIVTVIMMLMSVGFGASAFGKKFRYYSIATIVLMILFGGLTGMEAPGVAENLPTPMIGVWERISIGVFLLWVIVFAAVLLRKEKGQDTISWINA